MNKKQPLKRLFQYSTQIKNIIEALVLPNNYTLRALETISIYQDTKESVLYNTPIITEEEFLFYDVKNQLNVWDFLLENDFEVDEELILSIHHILSINLGVSTFVYRSIPIELSKTYFEPPLTINNDSYKEYLEVIERQDPIEIALFIMKNQMFENTNKRTAFYVMTNFFLKYNKILEINKENHQEYIDAITYYYETNDDKWFRQFVNENLRKLELNLKEIKDYKNTRIKNSLSR